MAKFYGKVGYLATVETAPDVWSEQIVERIYKGDVTRNQRRYQTSETIHDDVSRSKCYKCNTILFDIILSNGCKEYRHRIYNRDAVNRYY